MTYEDKLTVCRMRLNGSNISSIAEELGCSYQTICNFLKKLPRVDRQIRSHPNRSNKKLMAVCADYLAGASIGSLAKTYRMSEPEVLEIFSYIAEKKPIAIRNSQYPALTDWMNLNGYTVQSFAVLLDIPASKLSRIINGRTHLRYETAMQIKDITGLPLRKIYNHVLNPRQEGKEAPQVSLEPPKKQQKEAIV